MITNVVMPKMGESITEGTILEWKKKINEKINKDETLLEIATDKVDSEIPSPAEGFITEILFQVNDTVPVGEVIARISTKPNEVISKEVIQIRKKEIKSTEKNDIINDSNIKQIVDDIGLEKQQNPITNKGKRFYSPLVKKIAKKEGINLDELELIPGSGRNNRINKKDLLDFIQSKRKIIEQPLPHIPNTDSISLENRIEKMDRVRKKIGTHMVESLRTSPHVYSTSEVDMTNIVDIRNRHKDAYLEKYGVKLTYTSFILKICVKAIQEYPLMNAKIEIDNIIHQQNINLGLAVALSDGNLIVPNINCSEERNFLGLARKSADLANRARKNELKPDEIFGSTFTITNPGMFGSLFGMAIINQPNVGILSVGAIKKRPVAKETEYGDVVVIRSMMYLTLGYDHRLIDGAYGTQFLGKVCNLLENFNEGDIF